MINKGLVCKISTSQTITSTTFQGNHDVPSLLSYLENRPMVASCGPWGEMESVSTMLVRVLECNFWPR